MPIIRNAAFEAFDKVPLDPSWAGTRIKDVRDQSLVPGGRAHITLFEAVGDGRPHPRLQTAMPPAVDPDPGAAQWSGGDGFTSVVDFKSALAAALEAAASAVAGADLKDDDAPKGSLAFYRHSIRTQRIGRLFAGAAAAVASAAASGLLGADEAQGARYALEEAKALAYAGKIEFDDHDTGTYHSYGHDAPFVHYLETLLEGLPDDGSPEMALLSPVQREAIRRQRRQAQNHLDHLMRHKYAYRVVVEDDVEKTVGGLLIDRETREVVSETPASQGTLVPRYELLRIAPELAHAHAGAMVHRDGVGGLRLRDGAAVMVPAEGLRTIPVEGERLTFERAPKSDLLRPKQRLDWDRNGYVQSGPISWVSWAGHCDIKAIMEQLGLVLADNEFVKEYRSDTDDVQVFHRDLVLEMLASVMELGSRYSVSDGSGTISRGVHLFGGARNDSRPDRLQFRGLGEGAHFRWPLVGRKDVFTVTKLSRGEEALDLDTVFMRSIPNAAEVSFAPNPNYLKTVEGDYNLIDVSGTTLEYRVKCDRFDEATGYPKQATEKVTLVLERGVGERVFLGTHVKDAGAREVYRVYLDREAPAIIAELDRFVHRDGKYMAEVVESEGVNLPLHADLGCTLSREMERDDPAVFQTLLDVAVRQGQNICADTDKEAAVWNGVVVSLATKRTGANVEERTERWSVDVKARFGTARLDYLLRRDADGAPSAYCAIPGGRYERCPDFLWQDFPDVGSKGRLGADWVINQTMMKRGIVSVEQNAAVDGGIYVHDDHIKNVFELLYAALAGFRWTIVHGNKRYGFRDEAGWQSGMAALQSARAGVEFEDESGSRRGIHRLDVNTASVASLQALAAIGAVLAARIVEDRTENGDFATVDALARVHGIGPARLRSLRTVLRT